MTNHDYEIESMLDEIDVRIAAAESGGAGSLLADIRLSVVETGISPADIADAEARHIRRLTHPLNVEHAERSAVRSAAALVRRFFLLDAQ